MIPEFLNYPPDFVFTKYLEALVSLVGEKKIYNSLELLLSCQMQLE